MDNKKDVIARGDLTTGSIMQKLILFALPVLFANVFTQLYNVADTIVVGRFVGSNALAAVGSVGSVNMVVHALLSGIGQGTGVVISQLYGSKNEDKLVKAINTSMILNFFVGIVMTVLGLALGGPILKLMNTPADIIDDAIIYLNITFIGLFSMMFYFNAGHILRAVGDSKFPMYATVASSIINIVLNIIFVVPLKMGVAGVAWATLIAQTVVAAALIVRIVRLGLMKFDKESFRIDMEILKPILRIGLPGGVQQMLTSLGMVILQTYTNHFGADMVATVTCMNKIDGFANMPAMAIATAATTFVGQNIGAGKMDRVKKGVRYMLIFNISIGVVIGAVMFIFRKSLLGLFTDNAAVIAMGMVGISFVCFNYWMHGIQQTCMGVIRGAGVGMVPMIIMVIATVVRLPIAYFVGVVPEHYYGIFISMLCATFVGMALMLGYYLSGRWKNKGVVKRPVIDKEKNEASVEK